MKEMQLEDNRGSFHGKCLVTYSQEGSVENMTQMAMLIRNPYIPESLVGLTVSYDDEQGKRQHQLLRQMLTRAQEVAAAADIHMLALNRVSTNIASGILHTMTEHDCGEVMCCLTDRTTDMPKSSLGTVIDNVLEGSHREVMVLRSIVPPGTLRRVIVCAPRKAEYEVGFYKWLEHICRIGEQLDCHLEFHAHPDTLPYIQGYMRQKHNYVRSEFHEMERWSQIVALSSRISEDHLFVFVTARPGSISYQPRFEDLPLLIYRYFGQTSVMLLFPDQWGDPETNVSIFAPNGTVVTRQGNWLRRLFSRRKA